MYENIFDFTLISSQGNADLNILSFEEFLQDPIFRESSYFDVVIVGIQTNASHKLSEFEVINKLCEYISNYHPRLVIYFSTGGLYKFGNFCVTEASVLKDIDEMDGYYMNKFLSEKALTSIDSESKLVILRPFFIFGPGQKEHFLIPRLYRKLMSNEDIELESRNGPKMNPIYVQDVCLTLKKLIDHLEFLEKRFILNVAGKELVSLRAIISEIRNLVGHSESLIISKDIKDATMAASIGEFMRDPIFFRNSFRYSLKLTLTNPLIQQSGKAQ